MTAKRGMRRRRPAARREPEGRSAGRRTSVLRAWLVFLGVLAVLQAILEWIDPRLWGGILSATARVTAWMLAPLGFTARAEGSLVISPDLTAEIIRECTAVHPAMLYVAAVAAFPCPWRAKLWGVGGGLPLILLVNQVRLISLFYIGRHYPATLEIAHMIVWQSLIIFFTVLLWLLWSQLVARR